MARSDMAAISPESCGPLTISLSDLAQKIGVTAARRLLRFLNSVSAISTPMTRSFAAPARQVISTTLLLRPFPLGQYPSLKKR